MFSRFRFLSIIHHIFFRGGKEKSCDMFDMQAWLILQFPYECDRIPKDKQFNNNIGSNYTIENS